MLKTRHVNALCLFALCLLNAHPARAQYAASAAGGPYSGGTAASDTIQAGPRSTPYGPVTGGYGGAANANVKLTAQCSGAISTAFTWTGSSPAPQSAIVVESSAEACQARSYGYPKAGDPSVACTDGMGDTGTVTTSYGVVERNVPAEAKSTSLSHTRYTVQGGQTISLTCSPTATAMSPAGPTCGASITYSAAVYPITIQVLGALMTTAGGNPQAYAGQQILAQLNYSGPGQLMGWTWNTSGGYAFKDFSTALTGGGQVPLGASDEDTANFYFYDAGNDQVTVSCTATILLPDNTTHTVQATSQPITFIKPTTFTWTVTNGYVQTNSAYIVGLLGVPSTGMGGENWTNASITIPSSVPQNQVGGTGCFAQLDTPNDTYTPTHTTPYNSEQGLDTNFPLQDPLTGVFASWNVPSAQPYSNSDSPGVQSASGYTKVVASDAFTTWMMFEPNPVTVTVAGQNQALESIYIPIANYNWNWGGTATLSGNAWILTNTSPASAGPGPTPSATSAFPLWAFTHTSGN